MPNVKTLAVVAIIVAVLWYTGAVKWISDKVPV